MARCSNLSNVAVAATDDFQLVEHRTDRNCSSICWSTLFELTISSTTNVLVDFSWRLRQKDYAFRLPRVRAPTGLPWHAAKANLHSLHCVRCHCVEHRAQEKRPGVVNEYRWDVGERILCLCSRKNFEYSSYRKVTSVAGGRQTSIQKATVWETLRQNDQDLIAGVVLEMCRRAILMARIGALASSFYASITQHIISKIPFSVRRSTFTHEQIFSYILLCCCRV